MSVLRFNLSDCLPIFETLGMMKLCFSQLICLANVLWFKVFKVKAWQTDLKPKKCSYTFRYFFRKFSYLRNVFYCFYLIIRRIAILMKSEIFISPTWRHQPSKLDKDFRNLTMSSIPIKYLVKLSFKLISSL